MQKSILTYLHGLYLSEYPGVNISREKSYLSNGIVNGANTSVWNKSLLTCFWVHYIRNSLKSLKCKWRQTPLQNKCLPRSITFMNTRCSQWWRLNYSYLVLIYLFANIRNRGGSTTMSSTNKERTAKDEAIFKLYRFDHPVHLSTRHFMWRRHLSWVICHLQERYWHGFIWMTDIVVAKKVPYVVCWLFTSSRWMSDITGSLGFSNIIKWFSRKRVQSFQVSIILTHFKAG